MERAWNKGLEMGLEVGLKRGLKKGSPHLWSADMLLPCNSKKSYSCQSGTSRVFISNRRWFVVNGGKQICGTNVRYWLNL